MSSLSVTYRFHMWRGPRGKVAIADGDGPAAVPAPPEPTPSALPRRPSDPMKVARTLALAHHIERMVDAGVLVDYADAARRLGVSRARISQIVALVNAPVPLQEAALGGAEDGRESAARRAAMVGVWPGHGG